MPGASVFVRSSASVPAYCINLVADSGRRLLGSAVDWTCILPRTHNTYGDNSFIAAGPHVWNTLPLYLRRDISYGLFKRKLKTILFGRLTDRGAL